MPRRPRILIEGWLYHVYNRFARGEIVFSDPEEAIAFVELLRDVKQRDGMTILAWAVLSNHFHLDGCHVPYCCISGQCNNEVRGTHP